jgi:hypothetical protein
MGNTERPIAIYSSNGEVNAFLVYPYLFNRQGEWIGWVTSSRVVYSVLGHYAGFLTNDPRILRKRVLPDIPPRRDIIARPGNIYPPANIPLAPLMPELSYDIIDVFIENPGILHTVDSGELKEDLD